MNYQKKILIIAPAWVGDLVMSQALFRLLKQKNPKCIIDVLASKTLHPILKHMPEVNNYLESPFVHGELNLFKRYKFAKKLRKKILYPCIYIAQFIQICTHSILGKHSFKNWLAWRISLHFIKCYKKISHKNTFDGGTLYCFRCECK